MDSGMAPVTVHHGNVLRKLFVYAGFNTRTLERAAAQVELCDIVAQLADVARQREALVPTQRDVASLCLHADELERELTCAHCDP